MLLRPTRVHAKFDEFHISAHGHAKNAPHFTLSNKDIPKTCPILDPNLWRGTFRGVCNTPRHGYMQNLTSFMFSHPNTPKTHPISPFPIRIYPKPARFYTQTFGEEHFGGVCFCAPTRVYEKFGGFHISTHGHTKNAPDFTLPNRDTPKTHPVLGLNLRRGIFRGVCNTPLHGYVHNSSSFIFPHPDTPKTHPILPFPIRIYPKLARF